MTSRTVVDSVEKVAAPPARRAELEASLELSRARYPKAIIERYLECVPRVAESAFIAPGAAVIGDVTLDEEVSIWPGCVLRGDIARIEIGARSNLQDGSVVHVGDNDPAWVGEDVVVGHRAVIHGCRIEDAVLVGIQATILDGALIGRGSVIGAGALVTAGTRVPARSLVLGVPGRVVRQLPPEEEEKHRKLAAKYTRVAHNHRHG